MRLDWADVTLPLVVTWAISVAALLLSCYNLYVQRHDKQPSIRVHLRCGFVPYPIGATDFGEPIVGDVPGLAIEVRNTGGRKAALAELRVEAMGGKGADVVVSRMVPRVIEPDTRLRVSIPASEVTELLTTKHARHLRLVRAVFVDGMGRRHLSRIGRLPKPVGEVPTAVR
jgi:hypothetical protein